VMNRNSPAASISGARWGVRH